MLWRTALAVTAACAALVAPAGADVQSDVAKAKVAAQQRCERLEDKLSGQRLTRAQRDQAAAACKKMRRDVRRAIAAYEVNIEEVEAAADCSGLDDKTCTAMQKWVVRQSRRDRRVFEDAERRAHRKLTRRVRDILAA